MAGKVEVRNWTPTRLARDVGREGVLPLCEGSGGEDSRHDDGCGWCNWSLKCCSACSPTEAVFCSQR